ncbi:MAG: integrase [Thiotrichales bacterium]|nr:MAG: integrase [Thiotrichales bacterium]
MTSSSPPLALIDTMEHINTLDVSQYSIDAQKTVTFLKCYTGSKGTFNSYRRDIERLLHWCELNSKTLPDLKQAEIESFIKFCQNPPLKWIGMKKAPRFALKEGNRVPNSEWRPFVVTISKAAHKKGHKLDPKDFELSHGAVKEIFASLSSFFNYLLQEEYLTMNPVALIRQKSKFIRTQQGPNKIRRISELQWQYVIRTAREMNNRTLFIMSALYSMYLRISELAASERWLPQMNDFQRDNDGNWWFTTVGKGNKQRQIAVSDTMLAALKHWREYLNLSSLPSSADTSPLLPKTKGKGPITSTTYIRKIVQQCFDNSIDKLKQDNFHDEAEFLVDATVHWLRHTGISDDIKHRPREHVRDDAGHSSSAITDKYIDIELRERHRTAKGKIIIDED